MRRPKWLSVIRIVALIGLGTMIGLVLLTASFGVQWTRSHGKVEQHVRVAAESILVGWTAPG